jgi:RNA polymerase sigma-70 factor (ECF subfamily)
MATRTPDAALATRDDAAFEALMRRYNERLFRAARAILKDDAEAEDAVQDAYLEAYRHLDTFRGEAQIGTWLTRIAVTQALMRLRKRKRESVVVPMHGTFPRADREDPHMQPSQTESPQSSALRGEIRQLLERRIDDLPLNFRTVFVLREVQELTVDETASALGIPAATVRTRLFRARALLREALARDIDHATLDVFGFAGDRCDRIVARVLARVRALR